MSLYKRKGSPYYWVRFTFKGHRISRSTGTDDPVKAQEYHDKLKASLWDQAKLGAMPDYTWDEVVERWLDEKEGQASYSNHIIILRWLDKYLGGKRLLDIDTQLIETLKFAKRKEGVKKSTVDRYLSLIRSVLYYAMHNEMLTACPRIRQYHEPNERIRWLRPEEEAALLRNLPDWLAEVIRFALATGLRHMNIIRLKWAQVDLVNRVATFEASNMKNRTSFMLPLNSTAVEIVRRQIGKHSEYVFSRAGQMIYKANDGSWFIALERAGIENFHFHDLRHTWATRHIQAGTPVYELQALGGWKNANMVRRYAHLSLEQLAAAAERVVTKSVHSKIETAKKSG